MKEFEWKSKLLKWLREICPEQNADDYCQIMADSTDPAVMKVRIFTHDYRYTIIVTAKTDDEIWLSCAATRRKSLAGVTDHIYADLVNEKFSRETWELIKDAILRFEFVKLTAKAKEEKWREMSTHFESHGKQYYEEWLQKGNQISDQKTYELVGEKEEGNPEGDDDIIAIYGKSK